MWLKLILSAFFLEGLLGVSQKLIRELDLGESRNEYIFLYNIVAAITGVCFLIRTKKALQRKEVFIGSIIGLMFCFAAFFCLQAVLELPGIIYFPVTSVGGILWVTFLSRLVWREKLRKTQIYGLLLACVSLVLLTS